MQELQLVQPELKGMHCCLSIAGDQLRLALAGPSQSWLQVASNDLQSSNTRLTTGQVIRWGFPRPGKDRPCKHVCTVLMVCARALGVNGVSASGMSLHSWSFCDVIQVLQMQLTNLL